MMTNPTLASFLWAKITGKCICLDEIIAFTDDWYNEDKITKARVTIFVYLTKCERCGQRDIDVIAKSGEKVLDRFPPKFFHMKKLWIEHGIPPKNAKWIKDEMEATVVAHLSKKIRGSDG